MKILELIVRNGRYFTVGDTGAEFVQYQPNDIIFNAEQTKQLLENGKITSGKRRGSALVEGTAFSRGTGQFRNASNNSYGNYATNNYGGSDYSGGGDTGSSTSESTEEAKEFKEVLDWIEVKINRIERVVSTLDKKATSAFRSWTERTQNLVSEMSKVSEEMEIQQAGYNRYMQEANAVGLSEEWAAKVREGLIDINTLFAEGTEEQVKPTEELAEKIQQYKEW